MKDYSHLKMKVDVAKPPALVKYIQQGTVHSAAGCQSVKDFLKSLDKKGDSSWLNEWDACTSMNKNYAES